MALPKSHISLLISGLYKGCMHLQMYTMTCRVRFQNYITVYTNMAVIMKCSANLDILKYKIIFITSPALMAARIVNGKWQISTLYRINTLQSITKQFVTGDNVSDPFICAKFGANLCKCC